VEVIVPRRFRYKGSEKLHQSTTPILFKLNENLIKYKIKRGCSQPLPFQICSWKLLFGSSADNHTLFVTKVVKHTVYYVLQIFRDKDA